MIYPFGVLLNIEGKRFLDEPPGPIDVTCEDIKRIVAAQTKGIAFCILDDKINTTVHWRRCRRSTEPPQSAPGIATLAHKLGCDGVAAKRSVAEYNRACRGGTFNPYVLDGLATHGLEPAKFDYAVPLDKPPYRA